MLGVEPQAVATIQPHDAMITIEVDEYVLEQGIIDHLDEVTERSPLQEGEVRTS